jgi:hypothetical protein
MGENPTKYSTTSPRERVAKAGHRAAAVKLRAPEMEVVVADCMIEFLSCLESSTDVRMFETAAGGLAWQHV